MASSTRHTTNNIADTVAELSGDIARHEFVSVLRSIECDFDDEPRIGRSIKIADEPLRFSQTASLAFKGTALESFGPSTGKHPYRLYCNFLGLFGSNGPLPLHFTEYAHQRARNRQDETFREFLDIFNHRMLSLFYRSIAEFDPAINEDRPATSNFNDLVGALGGYMLDTAGERDTLPDAGKRYYSNWMGSDSTSPDGLESMLGEYFGITVKVHEFVGDWLTLPRESLFALGGLNSNSQLHVTSYIGRKVWSIGHKFKLSVGPLTWDEFQSLKPESVRAKALFDLVRNYVGDEQDWDLELLVDKGKVGSLQLNRKCSLGFDSWLASNRSAELPEQSVHINRSMLHGRGH